MSTSSESPKRRKPSLVHSLGLFFLILGATLIGVFLTRQLKEAGTGHTYYEFIGSGVVLAIIGLGIIVGSRGGSKGG